MELLIAGGGFAGLSAALNAAVEREAAGVDAGITLVSRDPWLCIRPRLYEADPESLRAPLPPVLEPAGIGFIAAEVRGIEADAHVLKVRANGEMRELAYDRLVLAAGSVLKPPAIPGAREHGFDIDTWDAALSFDRRLAALSLSARDSRPLAIAIVGAGMCGIELACELRGRIALHAGNAVAAEARILLFEKGESVGPEFGAQPRPVIEEALARARVEIHAGVDVVRIGADELVLADGRRFASGATVIATGMRANPLARALGTELDPLGRLMVDDSLRVKGVEHVYAAGDIAHAVVEFGKVSLMSCQHARTMGKFAGGNALRDMLGLPPRAYCQTGYTTCLDLGDYGAVLTTGWERQVRARGMEAKQRKRWINRELIYPPAPGSSREAILDFGRIDPVTGR